MVKKKFNPSASRCTDPYIQTNTPSPQGVHDISIYRARHRHLDTHINARKGVIAAIGTALYTPSALR